MVCQGTRKFVLMEVKKLGLKVKSFESGELEFNRELTQDETSQLVRSLGKYGLELVSRKNRSRDARMTFQKSEPGIPVVKYNFMEESESEKVTRAVLP
jgi:hypothetical protein